MTPLFAGPKSAPAEEYCLSSLTFPNSPEEPFNFQKITIDFLNRRTIDHKKKEILFDVPQLLK
jgi:hypothetical protein